MDRQSGRLRKIRVFFPAPKEPFTRVDLKQDYLTKKWKSAADSNWLIRPIDNQISYSYRWHDIIKRNQRFDQDRIFMSKQKEIRSDYVKRLYEAENVIQQQRR